MAVKLKLFIEPTKLNITFFSNTSIYIFFLMRYRNFIYKYLEIISGRIMLACSSSEEETSYHPNKLDTLIS